MRPLADPLNLHSHIQQQQSQSPSRASPPRPSPTATTASSSSTSSGRAPNASTHLRQRSIGTSPSVPNFPGNTSGSMSSHSHGHPANRSPFDDTHAAAYANGSVPDGLNGLGILGQPTPHRAALMQSNASVHSLLDSEDEVGRSQALAMRSERPEWVRPDP